MNPRHALHMMGGLLLIALALEVGTIHWLHDARTERAALHVDLVHSTLQRRALAEKSRVQAARVAAHDDILSSCQYDNARLAAMWAEAINRSPTVAEGE